MKREVEPTPEATGLDHRQKVDTAPEKRRYAKPVVSDFVQPAVAFGTPGDPYIC